MAVVVTAGVPHVIGDRKRVQGTLAFDDSYPTGGEAVTPSQFGFALRIDDIVATNVQGYDISFDRVNQKLLAFRTDQVDDPEEQAPDTTDLSGITAAPFTAVGV